MAPDDSFEGRNGPPPNLIMRIAINTCKDYSARLVPYVNMAKAIEDIPLSAPDTWKNPGRCSWM